MTEAALKRARELLVQHYREIGMGNACQLAEIALFEFQPLLDAWAQEARSQCAERIEKVAAQCAAGGHTSRAKMLNALATEFRAADLEQHKEE
jgi:hypothetical protein